MRIKHNFIKTIPVFIILNIPFGGPLFFAYMKFFPNFTPTWVITDKVHDELMEERTENMFKSV